MQGRSPGDPSSLFLDHTEAGTAGKKMFLRPTPPLSQDLDDQVPPII